MTWSDWYITGIPSWDILVSEAICKGFSSEGMCRMTRLKAVLMVASPATVERRGELSLKVLYLSHV